MGLPCVIKFLNPRTCNGRLIKRPFFFPPTPTGEMAESRKYTDDELRELPDYIEGQWYMFAVPGGFLMFGRFIKKLGLGEVRMADVRHMRNAGDVELPAMCTTGSVTVETQLTKAKWPYWDGVPLWKAPIVNPFATILE